MGFYFLNTSYISEQQNLDKFLGGRTCIPKIQDGAEEMWGNSAEKKLRGDNCYSFIKHKAFTTISQVHNFQKLKKIQLKAVNFFSNKNKSNLFEWNCLFSSSYSGVTVIFTAMWVILSERPFT